MEIRRKIRLTPRKRKRPEKKIQYQILKYLHILGCVAFKVTQVGIWVDERKCYIPLKQKGVSDIVGTLPVRIGELKIGIMMAIEVKTPGSSLTTAQKEFLEKVKSKGGIATVASNVDDVAEAISEYLRSIPQAFLEVDAFDQHIACMQVSRNEGKNDS